MTHKALIYTKVELLKYYLPGQGVQREAVVAEVQLRKKLLSVTKMADRRF